MTKPRFIEIILILAVFIVTLVTLNSCYNQRTINGIVEKTFIENGSQHVYIRTSDGNGWIVCDNYTKDYVIGQDYVIKFNCMGTDEVWDDEIVSIK